MAIDLTQYTEHELVELNLRIVDRIRFLQQTRCYQSMAQLNVGERVSFSPECGHVVVGTVVRLNKKSVTVLAQNGQQWRVAPSLLSKLTDAELELGGKTSHTPMLSIVDGAKSRRQ